MEMSEKNGGNSSKGSAIKSPILLFLLLFIGFNAFSQEFEKPTEGKSLVYFVRVSGSGALINFKYFDGDKYLGKMSGANYFTYECEPGEHIFWVAAENRDFVKENLKPNATYIIEVKPTMGAMKSAVRLNPVSPDNEKVLKGVKKIVGKKAATELKGEDEDMAFFIKNGLDRYGRIQDDVKVIDPNWTF